MTFVLGSFSAGVNLEMARCTLVAMADAGMRIGRIAGRSMLSNFYALVARDLSGTGVMALAFAGVLGTLLIWDARGSGERLKQQNK